MNKRIVILGFLIALSFVGSAHGQYRRMGIRQFRADVIDGDTVQAIDMMPIYIFSSKPDMRKYERLIRNVKKVYPVAIQAEKLLAEMEAKLLEIESPKAQKAYVKSMEKELKKIYTPILKNMTFSQGKILIKLIDRQTGNTSHALVKELRGGFSAAMWQGLARIFGMNLKDTYDKDGEDAMLERIVLMYEAGLI